MPRWFAALCVLLLTVSSVSALTLGSSGGGGLSGTPSCLDTGGAHLNYDPATGVFCGASSSGGAPGNAFANSSTKGIVAFPATTFTCSSGICDLQTVLPGRTLPNTTTLTIKDTLLTLQDDADPTKQLRFQLSGIPTTTTVTVTVPSATGILLSDTNVVTVTGKTLQDTIFTGTVIGLTSTHVGLGNVDNTSDATKLTTPGTLQNKTLDSTNTVTLKDTLFTLQDDGDPTKQARFQLAGLTTGTIRTYTLPDVSDTLMCVNCAQTAMNKTFTNVTISALANLTTNGFVKTSGGVGTLSVDTASYTPTTRLLTTTSPLGGGGDLSLDRTLTCATCTTNASALTSNLPVIGAGSNGVTLGSRSGNTTAFVTLAGAATVGTCLQFDANGNAASTGSACGSGGGGAVNSVFGRSGTVVATSGDYTEAQISFTDITTNNATITAHGYLKKLSNSAGEFLNGQGNWVALPGGGNVSNVGTPTSGQVAEWTSATTIQGVTATGTGSVVRATSPALVTPTGIVKGDVGLGNVDNTSDVTKNAATVTLTNKTLDASNTFTIRDDRLTLQDNLDVAKQVQFQLSGITTGQTRVFTFPDFSATFASLAGVESLSNKTLVNALFTTSLTGPLLVGGTGTSSSLTLQSTSGVGATDSILFKVGNNGGTTAGTFDTSGNLGLGVAPSVKLHLLGNSAELRHAGSSTAQTLCHQFYDNNVTLEGGLCYQGASGTKSIALLSNASDGILLNNINDVAMRFATNNTTRVSLTSTTLSIGANGATNALLALDYSAGSVATGVKITGGAAGAAPIVAAISSGTNEGLQLDAKGSGDITLQKVSTGNVILGGNSVRTFGLARQLTSNTAGSDFTVAAGSATISATDKKGGDLVLAPGLSTGTGRAFTRVQCAKPATATGTSDATLIDCVIFGAAKRVSNNTTTSVVSATIANNTSIAIQIDYAIESKDASNVQQVEGGRVVCVATNTAGTVAQNVCTKAGNIQGISNDPSSTLVTTWSITAANPAVIQVNANSSLSNSSGFPLVNMAQIQNLTSQAVSVP
jgi:hypothetical protein